MSICKTCGGLTNVKNLHNLKEDEYLCDCGNHGPLKLTDKTTVRKKDKKHGPRNASKKYLIMKNDEQRNS